MKYRWIDPNSKFSIEYRTKRAAIRYMREVGHGEVWDSCGEHLIAWFRDGQIFTR